MGHRDHENCRKLRVACRIEILGGGRWPHEAVDGDAESTAASAIAALVRARQQAAIAGNWRSSSETGGRESLLTAPFPDIRAIVVGHEFGGHPTVHRSATSQLYSDHAAGGRGFMISGSEDRKLRLWDLSRIERTAVLSGVESESERPTYRYACFRPLNDCAAAD